MAGLLLPFIAVLSLVACGGTGDSSGASADEVKYSFGDTPGSVVFDWHGAERTIYYGSSSSYGHSVIARESSIRPQNGNGRYEEAVLEGLRPNSSYHYKIGEGGADHVFHTIPTGSFRWVDVGDTMSSSCHEDGAWMPGEQRLIAAQHPIFVTHGGDIAVPNQCGLPSLHQYFQDEQVWSFSAAFQPVWGDHEWEGLLPTSPADGLADSNSNYKGRIFVTHAQTSPADTVYQTSHPGCGDRTHSRKNTCRGEDWGWFRAGHVLFISYPETSWRSWDDWQRRASALMARAQADPGVDFIVTYGHRAPYTDSTIGPDPGAQAATRALAARYSPTPAHRSGKYVLNIAHHAHSMQVFRPIGGLVNVVNAAGGQGLTTWTGAPGPRSAWRSMRFGLLVGQYDAAMHRLKITMKCGPSYRFEKDHCQYGSTLYSRTFVAAKP